MSKVKNNNSNETLTEVKKFVDPFQKGVTYADIVEALGDKTVSEYYGELLDADQTAWLEQEIEHFKNKK